MKITLLLAVLACSSVAMASGDIIYGEDNRQDVALIADARIQEISKSIAGRVSNMSFNDSDPKNITFGRVESLSWSARVCSDERFASQPTASDCTGFLVAEDLLVTAGHCVMKARRTIVNDTSNECSSTSWLFDYKADKEGSLKLESTNSNNLYKCKKIVFATLGGAEDYAIIQLDRKVVGRKPLKLRTSGKINVNQSLFVMGHPSGLPQKYADGAKVFTHEGSYFSTNLDTFGGNSGSPVFNMETYEVEGILVRGATDYIIRSHNGERCRRVNVCDPARENCLQETPNIDGEHVSIIERVLEHIK